MVLSFGAIIRSAELVLRERRAAVIHSLAPGTSPPAHRMAACRARVRKLSQNPLYGFGVCVWWPAFFHGKPQTCFTLQPLLSNSAESKIAPIAAYFLPSMAASPSM